MDILKGGQRVQHTDHHGDLPERGGVNIRIGF